MKIKPDLYFVVSISTDALISTSVIVKDEQIVILAKEEEYLVRH